MMGGAWVGTVIVTSVWDVSAPVDVNIMYNAHISSMVLEI